jgi:predicted transcriptional regulator
MEARAGRSIEATATIADCSVSTLCRILRGQNVSVRTAARILEALGYQLTIHATPKKVQDVVGLSRSDRRIL